MEEGNITHWQNTCLSYARLGFVPQMEGKGEGEEMGARGERESRQRQQQDGGMMEVKEQFQFCGQMTEEQRTLVNMSPGNLLKKLLAASSLTCTDIVRR